MMVKTMRVLFVVSLLAFGVMLVMIALGDSAEGTTSNGDVCYEEKVLEYWQKQQWTGEEWVQFAGGSLDLGWQEEGYVPPTAPEGYRYKVVEGKTVRGDEYPCPTTTTVMETTTTIVEETTTTTEAETTTTVPETTTTEPPTTTTVDVCEVQTVDPECADHEQAPPPIDPTPTPGPRPSYTPAPVADRLVLPDTGWSSGWLIAIGGMALAGGGVVTTWARKKGM